MNEITTIMSGVFPGYEESESDRIDRELARIHCITRHGYYPDKTCSMYEWLIFQKDQSCVTWGLATCTALVATNQDNVLMAHLGGIEESYFLAIDLLKKFQPDTLTVVCSSFDSELKLEPGFDGKLPFFDFKPNYITYDWKLDTSSVEAFNQDKLSRMVSWHNGKLKEHFLRKKWIGNLSGMSSRIECYGNGLSQWIEQSKEKKNKC